VQVSFFQCRPTIAGPLDASRISGAASTLGGLFVGIFVWKLPVPPYILELQVVQRLLGAICLDFCPEIAGVPLDRLFLVSGWAGVMKSPTIRFSRGYLYPLLLPQELVELHEEGLHIPSHKFTRSPPSPTQSSSSLGNRRRMP
jgi:hypothetical protein